MHLNIDYSQLTIHNKSRRLAGFIHLIQLYAFLLQFYFL